MLTFFKAVKVARQIVANIGFIDPIPSSKSFGCHDTYSLPFQNGNFIRLILNNHQFRFLN
ncbi:Uncharacterised protein [Salmonella enterica subsp. enterica serovar Typhi]|nr:Uncharacterised protein [Salmonella enterica subsp. enterica serovar Typhi]